MFLVILSQQWRRDEGLCTGGKRGGKVESERPKGVVVASLGSTFFSAPFLWRVRRVAPAMPKTVPARCACPAPRPGPRHGSGTAWRDFSHSLSHFSCDRGPLSHPATPPTPRARGHTGGGSPCPRRGAVPRASG